MNIHDPPENANLISAIVRKCLITTSSNFASISPLSGVFNLLCNEEGKEASVKVSD